MCGIIGWRSRKQGFGSEVLESMLSELRHRGPDDKGFYWEEDSGVALAQHRLSLIDLSESGHQPMEIDNCAIVYNGEIYNYQEIRTELSEYGVSCTGDSDTEVLLRAWQAWGESALQKFRGMFAFAIWEKKTKKLYLYRDRLGVKPLYYYSKDDLFIFASELKAILKHPATKKRVDADAVSLFLQLGYVPAPYSIFQDIRKLEAGCSLTIDESMHVETGRYWSIEDSYLYDSNKRTESEVLEQLEEKLIESFKLRMIADVPVGIFLSGGIDSSLVTAVLKKNGYENLSTYTIGFKEASHDESEYGQAVANYLGTNHHTLTCSAKEAQAIIPLLPRVYDEPFADASAIPTYLVSKFAKEGVTAALSADGGDELFGGYVRYASALKIFKVFSYLPPGLGLVIESISVIVDRLTTHGICRGNWSHKLKKARLFYRDRKNLMATYAVLNSYFSDDEVQQLLKVQATVCVTDIYKKSQSRRGLSHQRQLQHTDIHNYLPDNILVKVDRASMAVSLEGREPFLDHTLVEFVSKIPDDIMHKEMGNKYLLRRLLYKYLPRELVDRPKQGFGVPMSQWLKTDLRYLLDEFLSEAAVDESGLLEYKFVTKEMESFLSGRQPYNRVWNIIVLQMWYKEYLSK